MVFEVSPDGEHWFEVPDAAVERVGDRTTVFVDIEAPLGTVTAGGNHHGLALAPGEPPGQLEAGRHLRAWLTDTFGT